MVVRLRMVRYILFVAFAVLAACGGTAERNKEDEAEAAGESIEVVVVDYDSLFTVMDKRYNALCDERRAAYAERDVERRRELIPSGKLLATVNGREHAFRYSAGLLTFTLNAKYLS